VVTIGIAAAKVGGSAAAGRMSLALGNRLTTGVMLAAGAAAAYLLIGVDEAWLFVALLLVAVSLSTGVWPVCVDGAFARVSPGRRSELSIGWNVREPAVTAAATAVGGYLLDAHAGRLLLLGLAGILLTAAAVAALAVFRRPVYAPGMA